MSLFEVGKRLILRGPTSKEDKPDVDGTIVGRNEHGLLLVQESGRDKPTPVNIHGGWTFITVATVALVVVALARAA